MGAVDVCYIPNTHTGTHTHTLCPLVTVHKKRQTITVIQKMDNKHPGNIIMNMARKNNDQKKHMYVRIGAPYSVRVCRILC